MRGVKKASDRIYVVVDTNVLVSALLTANSSSSTVQIVELLFKGTLVPLYNDTIIEEYTEVLGRKKFNFNPMIVSELLSAFMIVGINTEVTKVEDEFFPDQDDIVFYEVRMSVEDSYLITGNLKHYPKKPFIVSPAQMIAILRETELI